MLIAPRNSTTAQLKLLNASNCNTILVAKDFPSFGPPLSAILSKNPMKVVHFASLAHWLENEKSPVYHFEAKLSDNPTRPYVILHTSGSTGLCSYSLNLSHLMECRIARTNHLYVWRSWGLSKVSRSGTNGPRRSEIYHESMVKPLSLLSFPNLPCVYPC